MTLTLYLLGPVRLVCPARGDITPRSQKARGALALLGSAHGLRISRAQLQDHLWSESPPEAGSTSLRQMLRELRQALGSSRDALVGGPGWIELDSRLIRVELDQPYLPGTGEAQFAADLDIGDAQFEDWLRDARMHHENRLARDLPAAPLPAVALAAKAPQTILPAPRQDPQDSSPARLLIRSPTAMDDQSRISARILLAEAGWRASELMPAELIDLSTRHGPAEDGYGSRAMSLDALARVRDSRMTLLVTIALADSGRAIATREFSWSIADELVEMPRAVNSLTTTILTSVKTLGRLRNQLTLWDMLDFDGHSLLETDGHLELMQQSQPMHAGVIMALRAYMRWLMVIERLVDSPEDTASEADDLAARARHCSPGNATVLGISSLLMIEKGENGVAKEFAQMAEQADPFESFGRLAKTQCLLNMGEGQKAHEAIHSMRNSLLASVAPVTWLMQRARTEVRLGLFEEAELSSATARSFAPKSRAALRFLGVLREARGDEPGAHEAFTQLRKIEPSFEPQVLADPSYPTGSLRFAGLVKA